MAAQSKAWVCSRSLTEIASSNTAGCMNVCFSCCMGRKVEISATGRLLTQGIPPNVLCLSVIFKPEICGGLSAIRLPNYKMFCPL